MPGMLQHPATSSGVPPLFKGIEASQALRASSGIFPVISVMINPGAMAFERTPREPSSRATDLVNPIIPAFDAE